MNFDQALMKYKYLEAKRYIGEFPGRLLDIGCGDGHFLYLAKRDFPQHQYHGIDVDENKLRKAQTYVDAVYHHSEFESWNMKMSFKFNYITAFNILEHVDDDLEFLEICYQRLTEHGRLIISVPSAVAFHKRLGVEMGITYPYELTQADIEKEHKHLYNKPYLEMLFRRAKFDVIGGTGVFFKPLPSDMLMKHYSRELFDGLYEMGKLFPDWCSSIMVVGEKR